MIEAARRWQWRGTSSQAGSASACPTTGQERVCRSKSNDQTVFQYVHASAHSQLMLLIAPVAGSYRMRVSGAQSPWSTSSHTAVWFFAWALFACQPRVEFN